MQTETEKMIPKPIHALELIGLHNVLGNILTYTVCKKKRWMKRNRWKKKEKVQVARESGPSV